VAEPRVPPTTTEPQAQISGPPADTGRYVSAEYSVGEDTDSYEDNDPSTLRDFREPLAPYGTWIDDPRYGTVWVPSAGQVGPDFTPYVTAGHWAYDDDYVWVSDYPWGWAPFHYGRWVYIDGRGWGWIPGRVYRGAWVEWSVDDAYGYLGWAALGPLFTWVGGTPVAWNGYWGPRWVYCPRGFVFSPHVGASVVVGPAAASIAPRMQKYVASDVRISGPPPARLGYATAQLPRPVAEPGISRALAFARPSTARALGASPPARFESSPLRPSPAVGASPVRPPPAFEPSPVRAVPAERPAFAPPPAHSPATAPRPAAPQPAAPAHVAPMAPAPPAAGPTPAGFRPAAPSPASGTFHGGGAVHVGGGGHR
jgi:hypothetical protein